MEYSEREDIELRTQAVHAAVTASASESEGASGESEGEGEGEMA